MTIESTIRTLESAGITIPARIQNALGVMFTARNARGVSYDASSELVSAFAGGSITPDNFSNALRDALVRQLTSKTGPTGAAMWAASEAVERAAENQVRQWLAIEFDSILDHFGGQFDQQAEVLAAHLPKATPPGASQEEVLRRGQAGVNAAAKVSAAEAELSRLRWFLESIASEAEIPLGLDRFVDSGDDPLPEEAQWSEYVRRGYRVGIVSEERAQEIALRTELRAREIEAEEWETKIRAEFEKMSQLRERGLRPNFVLTVPAEHESLVDELAPLFNFSSPAQYNRAVTVL
jgi:hypothetical protein